MLHRERDWALNMSLGIIQRPVLPPFKLPFLLLQQVIVVLVLFIVDRRSSSSIVVSRTHGWWLSSCWVIILLRQIILRTNLAPPLMRRHSATPTTLTIIPASMMLIPTVRAILPARTTEPKDETEINQPHPRSNGSQDRTGLVKHVMVVLAVLSWRIPHPILILWQPRGCESCCRYLDQVVRRI
ncbi:MAG: hypothetical protein J3R72DRAFT_429400 [Linnemannia gamsii]|nr:MAG: hypothetical protein J3R72DRAFT_429400 [Linnemannia gamsii]